jgi:hypothetical protein
MYKRAKTLMHLAFFAIIPALLSACGGNTKEDISSQSNNMANNPGASSNSTGIESASSQPGSSASQNTQVQSSTGIDVKPSTTIQLKLYQLSENSITLIWDDMTGISHYEISRNGALIARVDHPSYMLVDQGLTPYTNYYYTITAFDLKGNQSGSSQTFTMRTLAASGDISSKSNLDPVPINSLPSIGTTANTNSKSSSGTSLSSLSSTFSSNPSLSSPSSAFTSSSRHSLSSLSSVFTSSSRRSLSSLSSASSKTSSASNSSAAQTITISWDHPSQRENGAFLQLEEIGGYEIRYRNPTDKNYTHITLKGNSATEYTFPDTLPVQGVEFEIAVFDTAGLYSQFVKVSQ